MHHINMKKEGKKGEMVLKLDMSKAYNRVEWGCLDKIMEKLGFESRWRKLLLTCISTVTYSIRINRKPHEHIVPSRGLRQGDPLSPYLFLLCAEGLSALIKKGIGDGQLEGISFNFLQMIASFFVKHHCKNVTPYKGFSRFMRELLANN